MNRVLNLGFSNKNEVNLKSDADELALFCLWHHVGVVNSC
jgi:hypothetical protein